MMENTQKIRYKTGLQSKKGDNIITVLETLRIKKNKPFTPFSKYNILL